MNAVEPPSIAEVPCPESVADWPFAGWLGGHSRREAHMDALSIFGFGTVGSMLVTCALELPERRFTLAFAGACLLGSICGCLQGAWTIGSIEAVGALVALGSLRMRS